jgi:transketolase
MQQTECITDLLHRTRLRLLRMHYEAQAGHLGGNFSCIDLMMVLHHQVMDPHDRFVLSKGHSAGALYATLWSLGKLSDEDLATFSQDDSLLPGHPSGAGIPDLLFSTGSLGHGPSLAVGLALAARHAADEREPRRVFCLCSDGEWQEGSCWEALTMAIHHRLSNLVIIIDQNGLQGFGETAEVISCADLTPRLAGFGAEVRVIDAHDPDAIRQALAEPFAQGPGVVLANSIKGRGLPYAGRLESHYLPLDESQYREAVATLNATHGGAA